MQSNVKDVHAHSEYSRQFKVKICLSLEDLNYLFSLCLSTVLSFLLLWLCIATLEPSCLRSAAVIKKRVNTGSNLGK